MVKHSFSKEKEKCLAYVESLQNKKELDFFILYCSDITDESGYSVYFSLKTLLDQSICETLGFIYNISNKFDSLEKIKTYISKPGTVIEKIKIPVHNIIKIKTITITNTEIGK